MRSITLTPLLALASVFVLPGPGGAAIPAATPNRCQRPSTAAGAAAGTAENIFDGADMCDDGPVTTAGLNCVNSFGEGATLPAAGALTTPTGAGGTMRNPLRMRDDNCDDTTVRECNSIPLLPQEEINELS